MRINLAQDGHASYFPVMAEHDPRPDRSNRRRATNLSLEHALLEEARRLGINLSQAAQEGIEAKVREAQRSEWIVENAEAIRASNHYVERHGLPLAKLRRF